MPTEVAAFETNPNVKDIVAVRYLDDAGKHPDMETPGFAHFAPDGATGGGCALWRG